jgi:hypothetical protein
MKSEQRMIPPDDCPLEIVVYSDEGFIEFARKLGYSEEVINSLSFQSINSLGLNPPYARSDCVVLHVPKWRWEVDEGYFRGQRRFASVTFV